MKLAWLVWRDDVTETPEIYFSEPYDYYFKVVAIVYAAIVE